ncbi:hypothetical protein LIER_15286 [Lithospermum erythrorhizon]|uniref:Uncharacterized protein n=1 Tax=Lithospermum erythrorhizon TaxID=34254 RepID=A0AAV3Q3T1_LITER
MELPHTGCAFSWSKNWDENGMVRVLDRVLCNMEWLYQNIVAGVWGEEVDGHEFHKLQHYFKVVRSKLEELNKVAFSNISVRVVEMKHQFEEVQQQILNGDINGDILSRAKVIGKEYNVLCNAECDFYKNKARMAWYKGGDENTTLFHSAMKMNQRRNLITQIHNEQDELNTSYEAAVCRKVDSSDFMELQKPVTASEIEKVFLNMKSGTPPGPDGFSLEFYKDSWNITKQPVVAAIMQFFATCHLPRFVNCTALTLIPKVKQPYSMKDFQPKSCCNVIYKGRQISDGILLMHELMDGYQKQSGQPRCMLKVDIMKADDSVDWDSLWMILQTLNFPPKFIE